MYALKEDIFAKDPRAFHVRNAGVSYYSTEESPTGRICLLLATTSYTIGMTPEVFIS